MFAHYINYILNFYSSNFVDRTDKIIGSEKRRHSWTILSTRRVTEKRGNSTTAGKYRRNDENNNAVQPQNRSELSSVEELRKNQPSRSQHGRSPALIPLSSFQRRTSLPTIPFKIEKVFYFCMYYHKNIFYL